MAHFYRKKPYVYYRRDSFLNLLSGAKMVNAIEVYENILEGVIRKEEIDSLFYDMAFDEDMRYEFITFIRLNFAFAKFQTNTEPGLIEATNKTFYELGFSIPGLGKVKKKKRIFNYGTRLRSSL